LKPITVVTADPVDRTLLALAASGLVHEVVLLVPPGGKRGRTTIAEIPCREVETSEPTGGDVVAGLVEGAQTPLLLEVDGDYDPHPTALRRMVSAALETGAAMVYGDYADASDKGPVPHPLADCQRGSLENGFAFGPIRLWSVEVARKALGPVRGLRWMAWYALRLEAAQHGAIVRLPEPLGVATPVDRRTSGEKQFDYLTATRDRQIEAEQVATFHLKQIGALLTGPFLPFEPQGTWPVEATVFIPVRNRVKTVLDAVNSALSQKTTFPFNVIVVDNHSTDGTTELLRKHGDPRLVHVTPDRQDLGIGGCWNVGVSHPSCGKYVVQLDSDDIYSGDDTLQRMVTVLAEGKCGMAVGSYTLVNMALDVLPPGLIDHKEWTDDNGPNNALRIGGLGAPRAFATELLRENPFPNASYGEDYAVVLRICRTYRVGRVYDSLYLCRRWEDNSDADLNPATKAKYQTYKDRIRSLEIAARKRRNAT
jgi:hypothetical protein